MGQDFTSTTEQLHRDSGSDLMARGLGVFSLMLGAMEIAGARPLAAMLGIRGQEPVIQAMGAREILQGAAILAARDPTPWIWVRVAGDVIDIAGLAAAYAIRDGNRRQRRDAARGISMALLAVLGVTALDYLNARRLSRENHEPWQRDIDFASRSGFPDRQIPMRHGRPRSQTAIEQRSGATGEGAVL
jgi:hypothetical protein